jgi:hypothetical protein
MDKYDAAKQELLAKGFRLIVVPAVNPRWIREDARKEDEVSLYAEDS